MLKIKVLGPGCANCKRLEQITRGEVEKLGVAAEIEKITDYGQIMAYGVMSTPGLVIDDKVVAYGRIPSNEEVTNWLIAAQN
ncbi:MAG: TM0996/MTH895 family glutaredoxin-like protein [Ardenticatenaceae bacterium]|nr:TM0996/MTH895 family glutaredoxin-like protein [Ardenticatenaceae bacterium]MCB8947056.1 TM0996/MTH895 family glutaredoxin-like protein [Ardenticatenaceae bacterium]